MAGRENQGYLWDLASGLDLQLPIVCGEPVCTKILYILASASGHDVHSSDQDGHLTIAHHRIATGLCV